MTYSRNKSAVLSSDYTSVFRGIQVGVDMFWTPLYLTVKYFKGAVVNRVWPSLHGGSLEIKIFLFHSFMSFLVSAGGQMDLLHPSRTRQRRSPLGQLEEEERRPSLADLQVPLCWLKLEIRSKNDRYNIFGSFLV